MYDLIVTQADGKRRVRIPPEPVLLLIGRKEDCDIVLADADIDGRHLEVGIAAGGVRIRDMETRHGTRVNGTLVSQALVTPGDEIALGSVRIFLAEAKETAAAPRAKAPAGKASSARPRPAAPEAASRGKASPPAAAPRAPGSRPRTRRRGGMVWLVVLGVVVAVGALAFLMMSESGRTREAHDAYEAARSLRDKDRLDDAEREFRAVIENWPDTVSAARAKTDLEQIAAFRKHRTEANSSRGKLLERWTDLTIGKLGEEWDRLEKEYEGTGVFEDRAAVFASLKSKYRDEARLRIEATRAQAAKLVRAARYWDAILVWHEYASLVTNTVPDRDVTDREIVRIQDVAKKVAKVIADEAEGLIGKERFEEAKALLRGRIPSFRGTRHAFDLRQKLDRAEVLSRVETAEPEAVAEVVVKRDEFLRAADKAEALVQRRRYGAAVDLYRETAADIPFEDLKEEFLGRAADLEDYAFLLDELRGQINAAPERFRKIELGSGVTANATSADKDFVLVSIRGAQSKLAFARMGAGRILDLLLRLVLEPEGRIKLARFALEAGDEAAGHAAITKALDKDPALSDRAFAMLARARGIPVPEGGFLAHRGRWLTPTEKTAAELKDAIEAAERLAVASDTRRRDEGLAKLRELGEPATPALVRALNRQRQASVDRLSSLPAVRDPATKAMLYSELDKRRKAALVLIFDTVKYPYPYGPNQKEVQAEVDGLVAAVRLVWERPLAMLMEKYPELRALYEQAEAYSQELGDLGRAPEVAFADLTKQMNDAVGIKRYAPGGTEKSALEWNDKVLEYNRVVDIGADDPEKACVLATNLYRMMMGRRAVMMNDKLLKCARAHSTDMKTNNFFAHDCPIPGHEAHRTPGQRARIAGYGGSVSENIARGSEDGTATFRQWYGSSGHHRNLLGKNHTEVGVGRNTDFWTQNFGRAKKKVDLPGDAGPRKPGR